MRDNENARLTGLQRKQVDSSVNERVGAPTRGTRMFAAENQIVAHFDAEGNAYLVLGGREGALFRIQMTRI